MKTQYLNYCRQMQIDFSGPSAEFISKAKAAGHTLDDWSEDVLRFFATTANSAAKFMLPANGKLLEDPEFRAIEAIHDIRLPFPVVALEYPSVLDGGQAISKEIMLLVERPDVIEIYKAFSNKRVPWLPFGSCIKIPRRDFLVTMKDLLAKKKSADEVLEKLLEFGPDSEEYRTCQPMWAELKREIEIAIDKPTEAERWISVNRIRQFEASEVFFGFLNALACSNVNIERHAQTAKSPKTKAPFAFDDYHVLTIVGRNHKGTAGSSGSGRSPREHLRRGHIRRLDDGRRIWINATVVAAGTAGKVSKAYRLRNN